MGCSTGKSQWLSSVAAVGIPASLHASRRGKKVLDCSLLVVKMKARTFSGETGEKRLLIIVNSDLRYVLRREIKVRGPTPESVGWAVT